VLTAMLHDSVAPAIAPAPLLVEHCDADAKPPPLIETIHCQE